MVSCLRKRALKALLAGLKFSSISMISEKPSKLSKLSSTLSIMIIPASETGESCEFNETSPLISYSSSFPFVSTLTAAKLSVVNIDSVGEPMVDL